MSYPSLSGFTRVNFVYLSLICFLFRKRDLTKICPMIFFLEKLFSSQISNLSLWNLKSLVNFSVHFSRNSFGIYSMATQPCLNWVSFHFLFDFPCHNDGWFNSWSILDWHFYLLESFPLILRHFFAVILAIDLAFWVHFFNKFLNLLQAFI